MTVSGLIENSFAPEGASFLSRPSSISYPLIGKEFRQFDGHRKWEVEYGVIIVILGTDVVHNGQNHNLIGVDRNSLCVIWSVGTAGSPPTDGFTTVWFSGGKMFAACFSGYTYEIDFRTGEIIQRTFTK